MFKLTIDGAQLGLAVDSVTAYVKEGYVVLDDPTTFFMRGYDLAEIAIVECKLKCTIEGPAHNFCMEFKQLPSDMVGPVVMEVDRQLLVHAGRVNYKIDTLSPSAVKPVGFPQIKFTTVIAMPAAELKFAIKKVVEKLTPKDTSEGVIFAWKDNELTLEDIKRQRVNVTYERAELEVRIDPGVPVETALPADYCKELLPVLGKYETCILAFGNQMPVSIGCNTVGNTVGIGWLTANRMIGEP
jgi:hypothetical protein